MRGDRGEESEDSGGGGGGWRVELRASHWECRGETLGTWVVECEDRGLERRDSGGHREWK